MTAALVLLGSMRYRLIWLPVSFAAPVQCSLSYGIRYDNVSMEV